MTATDQDPVSEQPLFKAAAARLRPLGGGDGRPAPASATTAPTPACRQPPSGAAHGRSAGCAGPAACFPRHVQDALPTDLGDLRTTARGTDGTVQRSRSP